MSLSSSEPKGLMSVFHLASEKQVPAITAPIAVALVKLPEETLARYPIAVLKFPVVLLESTLTPLAVL
jgi:hypothetical protein